MKAIPNNTYHIFIHYCTIQTHTLHLTVPIPTLLNPPISTYVDGRNDMEKRCVALPLYYYQLNMHIHSTQRYKLNLT
jgi:hypothetical protein